MKNNEIYDTILIGKNPSIYLSAIYIQTYNMKQLLINEESPESLNFVGHDKISGLLDIKNNEDLVNRLEKQLQHLGGVVINDSVENIYFDSVFIVKCKTETFKAKSIIVDSKERIINEKGCFYSLENVLTKEAIDMMASGCKTSFAVREFIN